MHKGPCVSGIAGGVHKSLLRARMKLDCVIVLCHLQYAGSAGLIFIYECEVSVIGKCARTTIPLYKLKW